MVSTCSSLKGSLTGDKFIKSFTKVKIYGEMHATLVAGAWAGRFAQSPADHHNNTQFGVVV